jgi:hypothetical protein
MGAGEDAFAGRRTGKKGAGLEKVNGRNRKITTKAMENRRNRKRSSRPESRRSSALTEERNAERTLESSFFIIYLFQGAAPTYRCLCLTWMSSGDGWRSWGKKFGDVATVVGRLVYSFNI